MPLLGDVVPVRVSASEPERLTIEFDRVPSLSERALAWADATRRGDQAGAAEALGFKLREPPAE